MIVFEDVCFRYGARPEVLTGINLQLLPGSFHFLTGPSGSGKSTLLKLIRRELIQTQGSITIFDETYSPSDILDRHEIFRRIGYVSGDFPLISHISVFLNVALPLWFWGTSILEAQDDVVDLIKWVGLGNELNELPPYLSAGQAQRAEIARAVIGKPELILADEPTSSVDPAMANRIIRLFIELNRLGSTILIATHDFNLMEHTNAPRLVIHDGKIELR